jgi:DNA mismatch repair protein MutL
MLLFHGACISLGKDHVRRIEKMPHIQVLSTSLINKIAAGEVIERPASVVKEMLENSIDAGATRIELTVEGGGIDLIRIADDGCGIQADELVLAVSPHATSKLIEADDLFDIRTLGFRGEALASVAEISHLTIRSRTNDSESGAELIIRGGEQEGPRACAAPVGTTIEVRHLFFNTPVRRKFLKSPQTEMGHTIEAFTRIALAYPQVHMVLISNDRTLHDLPATHRMAERVHAFFGSEVSEAMIPIDSSDAGIRLHGYVVDPSVSRSNNRMQYLFLNGRFIRDRALQHALGEAYRGLLMVGRFPICYLHLDIPANQVDVNVHPTKSEVRFLDGGEIYRRLLQALRQKFLSSDLTARVRSPENKEEEGFASASFGGFSKAFGATSSSHSSAATTQQLPLGGFSGKVASFRPFDTQPLPSSSGRVIDTHHRIDVASTGPWDADEQPRQASQALLNHSGLDTVDSEVAANDFQHREHDATQVSFEQDRSTPASSYLGFQIHNRYLVTQDDSGMVLIDQHALHERVLYEQIRDRVLSKSMESQRLLIPEPITLTASEAACALEHREILSQMGIEIEPFGGDTVLMTAYPAVLSNISPSEMLRVVLEPLLVAGKTPDPRDLLDDMMNMMSCKAAIKAGDKLTPQEIASLLEQRHIYQDTHHCPHGRPTALFFSRDQLDKMFKRK